MSKADEWSFEEIIASIEQFDLGTKIRSNTGDIYNLSQAEGEGKQRKFSRWDGTKLRFLTYENIGKKFEILEDNTEEIEELNTYYVVCESDFKNGNIVKILNEFFEKNYRQAEKLRKVVNELRKDKNND